MITRFILNTDPRELYRIETRFLVSRLRSSPRDEPGRGTSLRFRSRRMFGPVLIRTRYEHRGSASTAVPGGTVTLVPVNKSRTVTVRRREFDR